MRNKEKLNLEKIIIQISFFGNLLFMILEFIIAWHAHSHAVLMDGLYDLVDLIMEPPFLLLIPLIYKPVTERRPFGFVQLESIFVLIKNTILMAVTIELILTNIWSLFHGGNLTDTTTTALFELFVAVVCGITYLILGIIHRRVSSPSIETEMLGWRQDVYCSIGIGCAFFIQVILNYYGIHLLDAYLDSIVAIIFACIMLPQPMKLIISSLKSLILFAADEEIREKIRSIATEYITNDKYELDFLEVIQTGRKLWVSMYLRIHDKNIATHELERYHNQILIRLMEEYEDVDVDLIPDFKPLKKS